MAQVTYRHGEPRMIDYTPGANVTAGDVVLLGNTTGLTCGVVHTDTESGILGAIAAGGGIYDATNLNNAANYAKVWWDDTNNKVTTTSTNNALPSSGKSQPLMSIGNLNGNWLSDTKALS